MKSNQGFSQLKPRLKPEGSSEATQPTLSLDSPPAFHLLDTDLNNMNPSLFYSSQNTNHKEVGTPHAELQGTGDDYFSYFFAAIGPSLGGRKGTDRVKQNKAFSVQDLA